MQQFLVSIPRDYYTVKQINKVKALGKEQQELLVDVREPKEYAHGHKEYLRLSKVHPYTRHSLYLNPNSIYQSKHI